MEDGQFEPTEEGTPQGGIISPILANVYLHYALDLWFEVTVKKACRGNAGMVRFADDFVCCFEREEEAKGFYTSLIKRLAKFGLEMAEEKTKILRFGSGSEVECKKIGLGKPETFDFLGFKHYWGKGKSGRFRLMRKTSAKKFRTKIKDFKVWVMNNRHISEFELVKTIKSKLNGHYQYYGVSDNFRGIRTYYEEILRLTLKWRNRRSQKSSFTLEKFKMFRMRNAFPRPIIRVNLFNSQYANLRNDNVKSRMP
jgi:hypothetical protein